MSTARQILQSPVSLQILMLDFFYRLASDDQVFVVFIKLREYSSSPLNEIKTTTSASFCVKRMGQSLLELFQS